jgi:four helix bundle protein
MRNFKDLEIWKDSIKLVKEIYKITENLSEREKFGLISQMNRCSISIPSNIAEGCAKDSQKDFVRFLQISLGSAFELETQMEICIELGFLKREDVKITIESIIKLQKQIQSLINYSKRQS